LGAWGRCAAQSAPLEAIRIIDDRNGLLRAPEVLFKAAELDLPSFGANIANPLLREALVAVADRAPRLNWQKTQAVIKVCPEEQAVRLALAENCTLTARLVVAADGRKSLARSAAGIKTRTWSYPQTAVAAILRHGRQHGGIATELHRRAGPLTVVPLPANQSSLVWVEAAGEAARLQDLGETLFLGELEAQLQGLLGPLSAMGPRTSYPLVGLSAQRMGQNRIALVGEAAHVIAPIGAQGLNLSLRDAAVLGECVENARAQGLDIGGETTLAAYDKARAGDVLFRSVSIDLLNRSLLTDFLAVHLARGVSLHLLANFAALRRLAMQAGLQPPGGLPRLMQPGALA